MTFFTPRLAGSTSRKSSLRQVLDQLTEGLGVFDAELQLRSWNPRFFELLRLDPKHATVSRPLQDLLQAMALTGEFGVVEAAEARRRAQRRLHRLARPISWVAEHLGRDGRTLELRRTALPNGGFVILLADISDRKAAQQQAADQQRMLKLLIDHTEQGIWFVDNGQLTTDANPAMCRMLGLTLPQMLGRHIFSFVDLENAAIFRTQIQQRALGRAAGYEIALRRNDGTLVHCYNNATPIFDGQGVKVGAVGMFSDISPLKQAEQQVRLSGALLAQKTQVLETTLDSLSQGVLALDPQGRPNAYNRRFSELLHIPQSLLQTQPTMDELGAYQIRQGLLTTSGMHPTPGSWRLDPERYVRLGHDGVVLEVRSHPGADGSLVRTYTDITANVQAQQALQESEAHFRTMADAAPALIWLSRADGSPLWFNQRWLQLTGRTLEQELTLDWSARVHPEDLQRAHLQLLTAVHWQTTFQLELRLLRADGQTVWVMDQGIPRFGHDGKFEGFTAYGWDITQRKAAEADLVAAKEEAERANLAKSEFLSRMSHELRTPLNAVLGFGQLLQAHTDPPLNSLQASRVDEMLRGGRHLLSLINDVLDLARIEAGSLQLQLQGVDLPSTMRQCLDWMEDAAAERGITLQVVPPPEGDWQVRADPTRLRQVLLNLLSNAVKYNRLGGRVQLSWRAVGANDVRIEVRDEGPGLTEHEQQRLFQAFERLDAAHGNVDGAGIGLALSKWLMELMQGRIGVDSVKGQGSCFWLELVRALPVSPVHITEHGDGPPAVSGAVSGTVAGGMASQKAAELSPELSPEGLAQPAARHTAPAALGIADLPPLPGLQPAGTARKVLYIEDNEVNQLLMEGMIGHRPGIRLQMAATPEAGLRLAAINAPDLLLLDIQLPGMDGYEVLRRFRAQADTRHIPVVAVSANAMPADRERAERAGFDAYITKPIDLQHLLSVMNRMLARAGAD